LQPELLTLTRYAPFFSGGGYCSEATAFVIELAKRVPLRIVQHGDGYNGQYMQGLSETMVGALQQLHSAGEVQPSNSVVICHSEPGAWSPPGQPRSSWEHVSCPPPGALYTVGRTMFETDRLPDGWAPRLNAMDEIWVPSQHSFEAFAAGGVETTKLRIVGEPIDTEFFDPTRPGTPYQLPPLSPGTSNAGDGAGAAAPAAVTRFISVFKWEARKAWDVLLRAYFAEFSRSAAPVHLYLLTNPYHNEGLDFNAEMQSVARSLDLSVESLPPVEILPRGVPQERLPALLTAMDAFVLPSRGEGWGRPHVEAMAMGLPVIATNWSGPTEYVRSALAPCSVAFAPMFSHRDYVSCTILARPAPMFLAHPLRPQLDTTNGYPVELDRTTSPDGLTEVRDGPFAGHRWAEPSVTSLREALRAVVEDPDLAAQKGQRARQTMVETYAPARLADTVEGHLRRIEDLLNQPDQKEL
jgi:glycosyltransferase involved in cell wall biosynthesis